MARSDAREPAAAAGFIEVVYALPERQTLVRISWSEGGMSAGDAVAASGICNSHPELEKAALVIGVFGVVCDWSRPLRPGDRVELYRPLRNDPRAMRRARAASTPQKKPSQKR
jgi:putative ubiquitin-RnfH superfamily antitoxin RatB of RatAB toxin-antitoxin module